MESYKHHIICRACNSKNLKRYLNLGLTPLSNNLNNIKEESISCERYPLEIMLCEDCGLSQLSIVVNPEKLYSYYTYRSSINKGYISHCREMAKILKKEYGLDKNSFHIDIASNDGALLKEFKEEIGLKVLGIDPSKNLARIAQEGGIPTIDDFWSLNIAKQVESVCGKADLITATNVFAHVDNIREFLEACKSVIKKNGIIVIECPYFPLQMENNDYTQTYFEHLSYVTVTPVDILSKLLGLQIIDLEIFPIHGGTIRFTIANNNSLLHPTEKVAEFLDKEYDSGLTDLKKYRKWGEENVFFLQEEIWNKIDMLKESDYIIAGFSASAKGSILLNSVGLNYRYIDYIIDETPEKQEKFVPGTGIPIVAMNELQNNPPNYILLLSYNFKDEIIEKIRKTGYKGKFIVPIPKFQIID